VLEPGTTFAGYRIDRLLGRGGMGEVYEATQTALTRTVALKIISAELSEDPRFRERFRREGRIQAQLDHPNIVTVHEAGESDYGLFIAMRFVRGPTLKELIVARQVDPERAIRILGPVAEALDAAHRAGLVHRDVKPQNILVGDADHAFLADFGLTKGAEDTSITESGQFLGTLDYIAPEQIHGRRPTALSDVYAFGGVLYESLTGTVPYPKESQAAVLYAHIADPPPQVTRSRPELPAELDGVIGRAMAKDPRDRHPAAAPIVAEADRILSSSPRRLGLPPPPDAPEDLGMRRDEADVTTERTRMELERMMTPPRAQSARPAQPTEPARPAATRSEHPRLPLLLGLAALAAVIAIAAALLGAASAPEAAALESLSSPSGDLEVSRPDSWQAAEGPAGVPGLRMKDARAARAPGSGAERLLTIGTAEGSAPTFLPDSLLDRLDSRRPQGEVVRVNAVDGYRYRDLRPKGFDGRVTIFAVPTTDGVAMVTCAGPGSGADSFMRECERAAATLELPGKDPVTLRTADTYARALSEAFGVMGRTRDRALARLERARSARARARAAADVSAAYSRAARAVSALTPGPGAQQANVALVSALERASSEWQALEQAARGGNRGAYTRARSAVTRAEDGLSETLGELRRLGFRVV
jgi:serine/threonine protein kinase